MSNPGEFTEEQRSAWVREQYQKATKYMAEKGMVVQSVSTEESRYIAPLFAVWKLHTNEKETFWVICGDLPADHIPLSAAPDGREAVRNFAMKWQLQAENIGRAAQDAAQLEFAKLLVSRAESLYDLFEDDNLWKNG